jgi:hypothetical protein
MKRYKLKKRIKKYKLIAIGYCHCGCGEKTKICKINNKSRNFVKGKPNKYLVGHNFRNVKGEKHHLWKGRWRHTTQGYIIKYCPDHPRSHSGGGVLEHILIVEKVLGRFLSKKEQVHHVNGKTWDNRNTNLVVCNDSEYHKLLHTRMRALKETGNVNYRKCYICKKWDKKKNLTIKEKGIYHPRCKTKYNIKMRRLNNTK